MTELVEVADVMQEAVVTLRLLAKPLTEVAPMHAKGGGDASTAAVATDRSGNCVHRADGRMRATRLTEVTGAEPTWFYRD